MSERLPNHKQRYIDQRLRYLDQQLQLQRARELHLRRVNSRRLHILQRGKGGSTPKKKMISNYYIINLNRARQSRKFKVQQNVYNVSLKELPKNATFARRLFRDLLKNVKQKIQTNPKAHVRLS
jgi:hypothetical protein